jgi:nucleotide-binding universal stress UspA family protein
MVGRTPDGGAAVGPEAGRMTVIWFVVWLIANNVGAHEVLTTDPVDLIADTSPAHALHELARNESADLVVVGSARHGKVSRALLGGVSRAVLHGSPCPVAVAPKGFASSDVTVVGVAFNGSPEAHEALRFAAGLASDRGARLRVRGAVQDPVMLTGVGGYMVNFEEVREDLRSYSQKMLDEAMANLDADVEVDAEAMIGPADEVLDALCADVDVVVCGSRGWGAVRRVVLGSTSDRLIHHARCPVIVVPRSAVADDRRPRRASSPIRRTETAMARSARPLQAAVLLKHPIDRAGLARGRRAVRRTTDNAPRRPRMAEPAGAGMVPSTSTAGDM